MLDDIVTWWKTLWTDHKPVATAIAGFISAILIFFIRDMIWQPRITRIQRRQDFQQRQLDSFYAPLYCHYREAYARFDYWRSQNPESKLEKQPFFDSQNDESLEASLFKEQSTYVSPRLLGLWVDFKAVDDKGEKNRRRSVMVRTLVAEYNVLRKELQLDYSESEIASGGFE